MVHWCRLNNATVQDVFFVDEVTNRHPVLLWSEAAPYGAPFCLFFGGVDGIVCFARVVEPLILTTHPRVFTAVLNRADPYHLLPCTSISRIERYLLHLLVASAVHPLISLGLGLGVGVALRCSTTHIISSF